MGGGGAKNCSEAAPASRTIEPYTATRKITQVQTLANGATITRESTSLEAVDSSGRRYQKYQLETNSGGDMQMPEFYFFNVYDPVNQTSTNWNSNSKEATVFHIPQPGKVQPTMAASHSELAKIPALKPVQMHTDREDLGTKTINGLESTGTRWTTTSPVGSIGNDQPLVVIAESWMSTELGIEVLQNRDDPRTGKRTVELTDIERGEPDSALFQVPEGYTVVDQNPGQQN